ncbi:NUDIX hydrolase [Streptomyces sp. NPDC020875]|uniref:NUDIX hydrolase n=1 Tax=Streptomyces sp. NPDC020875 TaxID=3154898 RepID=UPI0033E714E6
MAQLHHRALNRPALPQIAAAVVIHDGRLLLIHRAVPEPDLAWQLPAGKVEKDEKPTDAAARENQEETGVAVRPDLLLGDRIHPVTGRHVFYVACTYLRGKPVPAAAEVALAAWVPVHELPRFVPKGFYEPVQRYITDTATGPRGLT